MSLRPLFRHPAFHRYLLGIACVAGGAELSSRTQSMLPLALGAATAVMTTLGAIRAIRAGRQRRN